MSERRERFGPMPIRAAADPTLSALDLRVLLIIAAHDGFDRNGRGCFASHKRLAGLVCAHYKSVARSIANLIERGYIAGQNMAGDGRLRTYRVMYTEDDRTVFRGDGRVHAPSKPLTVVTGESVTEAVTDRPATRHHPKGEVSSPFSSGSVTDPLPIGNNGFEPTDCFREESERTIYSLKGNRKIIDTPEGGSGNGSQVAAPAILSQAARIAAEVQTGGLSIKDGIEGLAKHLARAHAAAQPWAAAQCEQMIDAAIRDDSDRDVAIELREVRPSPQLQATALYRKAKGAA